MKRKNNTRNNKRNTGIPENNPSRAMDSKREVEQSNDEKTDQDFPGYPHYPAREDVMDKRTDLHRVDMDLENLPNGYNSTGVSQRFITAEESKKTGRGTEENDKQENELRVFNSRDEEIGIPQNVTNKDLGKNVPGSNLQKDAGKRKNRN
jgi:hypothetical protein